jgi:hypothetical protein
MLKVIATISVLFLGWVNGQPSWVFLPCFLDLSLVPNSEPLYLQQRSGNNFWFKMPVKGVISVFHCDTFSVSCANSARE